MYIMLFIKSTFVKYNILKIKLNWSIIYFVKSQNDGGVGSLSVQNMLHNPRLSIADRGRKFKMVGQGVMAPISEAELPY